MYFRSKKKIVSSFLEELFHEQAFVRTNALKALSKNAIFHSVQGVSYGRETIQQIAFDWMNAFPNIRVNYYLEEYDNLVIGKLNIYQHYLIQYTSTINEVQHHHSPSFLMQQMINCSPTEQPLFNTVCAIFKFSKGKIAWLNFFGKNPITCAKHLAIIEGEGRKVSCTAFGCSIKYLKEQLEGFIRKIFTVQEMEYLALMVLGLPIKSISSFLDYFPRGIKGIEEAVVSKLGCDNFQQCLEMLFELELLVPFRELGYLIFYSRKTLVNR